MGEQQQWVWRSQPLKQRTGSDIFRCLFDKNTTHSVLLESPFPPVGDQPQLGRYSICAGSPRRVNDQLQVWTPALGNIFPCLDQLYQRCSPDLPSEVAHLPFTGGYLGWLGSDLAWEVENLPQVNHDPLPFPTAYWYEPECFAVLDHEQQVLWLAASDFKQLDALETSLETQTADSSFVHPQTTDFSPPTFLTSATEYQEMVRQAKAYIHEGDIFQANLSLRFQAETSSSSWQIYQALHQINPSPFASYWRTPWGDVISCSPERLVQRKGNLCQTRPIAGTRPRGRTDFEDQQLAEELRSNQKECAEHIMLVDLERNDLGRVCDWGTVQVDELFTIERYSHVMHLVSNVQGRLRSGCNSVDVIRSLFPGGTITGCPKVRCLEIIEELEPFRRSLFYGSCGYLDQRGDLDLNILIRTLLFAKGTVWGQVGAGIVADSDPQREWEESLSKGKAQVSAMSFGRWRSQIAQEI